MSLLCCVFVVIMLEVGGDTQGAKWWGITVPDTGCAEGGTAKLVSKQVSCLKLKDSKQQVGAKEVVRQETQ